jgi:host cell factor
LLKYSCFRYLNDLYVLECKGNNYSWEQPIIRGTQPVERESHSCVSYRGQYENRSKIIIYGGMNGHRLGDIWNYYLGRIFSSSNTSFDLFLV